MKAEAALLIEKFLLQKYWRTIQAVPVPFLNQKRLMMYKPRFHFKVPFILLETNRACLAFESQIQANGTLKARKIVMGSILSASQNFETIESCKRFILVAVKVATRFKKTLILTQRSSEKVVSDWRELVEERENHSGKRQKKKSKGSLALGQIPEEIIQAIGREAVRRAISEFCIFQYESLKKQKQNGNFGYAALVMDKPKRQIQNIFRSLNVIEDIPVPFDGSPGSKSLRNSLDTITEEENIQFNPEILRNPMKLDKESYWRSEALREAEKNAGGDFERNYQPNFSRGLEFSFSKDLLNNLQDSVLLFLNSTSK